jgi:hypothetical protein
LWDDRLDDCRLNLHLWVRHAASPPAAWATIGGQTPRAFQPSGGLGVCSHSLSILKWIRRSQVILPLRERRPRSTVALQRRRIRARDLHDLGLLLPNRIEFGSSLFPGLDRIPHRFRSVMIASLWSRSQWSGCRDLNPGPLAPQASALARLRHSPIWEELFYSTLGSLVFVNHRETIAKPGRRQRIAQSPKGNREVRSAARDLE